MFFFPRPVAHSRFAPQFAGYEQHDAQALVEFLDFILEGLHDDLNRGATGARSRSSKPRREQSIPKLLSSKLMTRGGREVLTPRKAKMVWQLRPSDKSNDDPDAASHQSGPSSCEEVSASLE
ncbi:UBP5, partial [Symbiodinium pilosum]